MPDLALNRLRERGSTERLALDAILDDVLAGTLSTAAGAPAALAVIAVDALIVGHSTFDSSANYRSAVVYGNLTPLSDEDRTTALDAVSERLIPGRTSEVRPMTKQEITKTLVMAMPISEGRFMTKVRTGTAGSPDEETGAWHGHVELRTVALAPVAAPTSRADEVPRSVRDFASARVLA